MNGFNNTAAEAMVETKQCYFEKLWTPTAANLGFNLTTSSNRILSIGFSNDAQPTVDGGIVRLNWYDEPSAVIKTLPVGAAANTTYKIILDARSGGESKLKVELYDSTFYVCPDDLHLVGSNLLSYMPSADNKFTYHGACNYSFTLRNDSNATATLSYTITNSSQSVQCANGTGASPPPNFYDPRSASITCAASVDPYSIDVPGKSTVRFFVHRTSAGDAVALTTRTLAPDYPVIALSGQAGDGLPLGGRNFHEPDYAYNYSYERPQSFIWTATAANTFQLAANWGNYFCSPINASAALISTAMPVRCRYAQTAPTSVFGPYNPGTLRIRFIPAVDVESNPHVTVEPYSQVNALVQVTSLFLGATTVVDPLASPNTDPTTTPGSMTLSQTWTAPNGELYLFGGQYANAVYNSLWRYAPGTGIWTLLNGTTAPGLPSSISGTLRPGARFGSVGWVDATNSRLYLFGGNGVGSSGTAGDLNDLWYYDIVGNTWNFVKGSTTATPTVTYPSVGSIGTPNSTYNPPARRYSTAFTDAGGNFWIYGGFDTNQIFYGDLWKFTPTSGTANLAGDWTWMGGTQGNSPTLSTDPVPVNRHSAAAWAVGNLVYVFGGLSYPAGSLNDLWTLNLTNGMWTLIQSHAPSEARFWENFAFHPDNKPIALWGVKPMTWKQSADSFWLYNSGAFFNYRPSIKQWAIVSPGMIGNDISGFPIDPVFDPNVYDMGRKIDGAVWSGSSGFFLYGGYTNSTPYAWNDMWRIQFPTP
ncbi:MAG: hypothetical protein EOP10_12155 [Proteobacteria bacterium]|nr:MAG: hypothetical protein EOP10_12155 [Pseudomonadota bacterium]